MSKSSKEQWRAQQIQPAAPPTVVETLGAQVGRSDVKSAPNVEAAQPETWFRVARSGLTSVALEEATVVGGRVVSRRVVHPPDIGVITLGRAMEALTREALK